MITLQNMSKNHLISTPPENLLPAIFRNGQRAREIEVVAAGYQEYGSRSVRQIHNYLFVLSCTLQTPLVWGFLSHPTCLHRHF